MSVRDPNAKERRPSEEWLELWDWRLSPTKPLVTPKMTGEPFILIEDFSRV